MDFIDTAEKFAEAVAEKERRHRKWVLDMCQQEVSRMLKDGVTQAMLSVDAEDIPILEEVYGPKGFYFCKATENYYGFGRVCIRFGKPFTRFEKIGIAGWWPTIVSVAAVLTMALLGLAMSFWEVR